MEESRVSDVDGWANQAKADPNSHMGLVCRGILKSQPGDRHLSFEYNVNFAKHYRTHRYWVAVKESNIDDPINSPIYSFLSVLNIDVMKKWLKNDLSLLGDGLTEDSLKACRDQLIAMKPDLDGCLAYYDSWKKYTRPPEDDIRDTDNCIRKYKEKDYADETDKRYSESYVESLYTELVACIDGEKRDPIFKTFLLYYLGHVVKSEDIKLPTFSLYARKAFSYVFYLFYLQVQLRIYQDFPKCVLVEHLHQWH